MYFLTSTLLICCSLVLVCSEDVQEYEVFDLPDYLVPPKPNQPIEYNVVDVVQENEVPVKKFFSKHEQEEKKNGEWVEGSQFKQSEIDCFLDKGRCDRKLGAIKKTIIRALANGCKGCSESEKLLAGNAASVMMFRQPELWTQFIAQHDKKNVFLKQHS